MSTEIAALKKDLRKKYLNIRKNLDKAFRIKADRDICRNLMDISSFKRADLIGAYITDGTEPDLGDVFKIKLEKGKKICLPRFNTAAGKYEMALISEYPAGLCEGAYRILEPAADCPTLPEELYEELVWLVPGVAFDAECRRLGRGKAVYDALLKMGRGLKIGVFYECQKDDRIPVEEHDCRLDMIVTEIKVYNN